MLLEIVREMTGCYLVFTLAATGLAKARAWRATFLGIARERVVPRSLALPVTIGLCTVEIVLAMLLVSRSNEKVVGLATTVPFLAFTAYKLVVVIKTGKDACSCTGTSTTFKATRPGVVASPVSSLIQAGCGILWAFGPNEAGMGFSVLMAGAFVVPVFALLAGYLRTSRESISAGAHV